MLPVFFSARLARRNNPAFLLRTGSWVETAMRASGLWLGDRGKLRPCPVAPRARRGRGHLRLSLLAFHL